MPTNEECYQKSIISRCCNYPVDDRVDYWECKKCKKPAIIYFKK